MANLAAIQEVPQALADFLRAQVPELRDVTTEWPNANQQMKLPSVTITTKPGTEFRPCPPYLYSQGAVASNKAAGLYVTGEFAFHLQIDIWCTNKIERATVLEKVFQAIRKDSLEAPLALELTLKNYFGVLAQYNVASGPEFEDDEISSETRQWRVKFALEAECQELRNRVDSVITTIETTLTTPNEEIT